HANDGGGGMQAGTSPSIAALPSGDVELAWNAHSLFNYGPAGVTNQSTFGSWLWLAPRTDSAITCMACAPAPPSGSPPSPRDPGPRRPAGDGSAPARGAGPPPAPGDGSVPAPGDGSVPATGDGSAPRPGDGSTPAPGDASAQPPDPVGMLIDILCN